MRASCPRIGDPMSFSSLFSTILTLFLLLSAGYLCGRWGIVDEGATKHLSNLIVKVGQPFLIIHSLIGLRFSRENLITGGQIFLLAAGIHVVMAAFTYFFAKPIRGTDERKLAEFAMVFTNCGFIGFPILSSIFGDTGLFYGAFYVVFFHLFTWTWGISILGRGRDDIRLTVKKALVNFGTIPSLIGLAVFVSQIPIPAAVSGFSSYLASLCTPVSVIITGANLSRRSLRKMFTNPRVYYVNLMRLVVLPLLVTTICFLAGLPDYMVIFACVMAAMPSAAIVTMFGELYGISPGTAAEFVGSTSVLCTATLLPVIGYANWLVGLR